MKDKTKMGKLFQSIGKGLKGVSKGFVRETLQSLPFVGTFITSAKIDTKENPKGKINLEGWDYYRLAIGLAVGYVLYKGLLSMEQIDFVLSLIGF